MRRLFALLLCLLPFAATAQDAPRTILVLDASGSMWGQIDGVTKIEIAREVLGGLLSELPDDQELGLTTYGHRRKGDCSDIETLIAPAAGQRDAIAAAVNSITPKGKTPLSAAVLQAAEALRYTEERATVILVSDGRETCDFDPCEVGRQLEETGVDFTAHVIGFDVSDAADRAELQCLADETGGTFRTASNASELAEALVVIAEPEPQPMDVTLRAIEGAGGPEISDGITWSLAQTDGTAVLDTVSDARPVVQILPGSEVLATVTRLKDGATVQRGFTVDAREQVVTLVLPELPPEPVQVLFQAQEEGSRDPNATDLVWSLYKDDGTPVFENDIGTHARSELLPGTYRIEVLRPADELSREQVFGVGEIDKTVIVMLPPFLPAATLDASAIAPAGATIQVGWTGPAGQNDFISVTEIGAPEATNINYALTREGSPLPLQMPPKPGTYELRYFMNEGRKVLTSQSIEVTPVNATLTAADQAIAGSNLLVDWTGPDYQNDYVDVAEIGAAGNQNINYAYTRDGSSLKVQMPIEPGTYQLRYIMAQDRTVLATKQIEVTELQASVTGPESAVAGATVLVEWSGGDYQNDFISIAEIGAADNDYENYSYTREGTPLQLVMPVEPGQYELRYVVAQDRTVVARQPITITELTASVTGPESAVAGSTITVEWTGGDYQNDFISIAEIGAADNDYENYTYTREGTPLRLVMPVEPGDYELRYVVNQDRKVVARQPISITELSASVTGPATATAGQTIIVEWTGGDYQNDFISVAEVGAADNDYENYTYTRDGNPLRLEMPPMPGNYELRYIVSQDRKAVARQPITVEEVTATLDVNATAAPASNLIVTWEGPDYQNDYIAISRVGDDGYEVYEYTRGGSPLLLKVPGLPGTYEVRYVMNQGRRVLVASPLTVQ